MRLTIFKRKGTSLLVKSNKILHLTQFFDPTLIRCVMMMIIKGDELYCPEEKLPQHKLINYVPKWTIQKQYPLYILNFHVI